MPSLARRLGSSALAAGLALGAWTAATAEASLPQAAADARHTATQVCGACHGADGNSPNSAVPSLAGQNPEYLYDQLLQFAAQGHRRANGVMGAMAVNLSHEQMRALADYFSYQTLKPVPLSGRSAAAKGEAIYQDGIARRGVPACASCHGSRGEGLAPSFPRLAGQHAPYVEAELKQFRDGRRASDPHAFMRAISSRLSNAEIEQVADFVARLR